MAIDYASIDVQNIDPAQPFDPIPAGKYLAVAIDAKDKPTKAGTGEYLECTFEIIEGPYKGRKVWDRFNLLNPNPQAVEIAKRQFVGLCHAINVMQPKGPHDLLNLPVTIAVKLTKRQDTGDLTNEIAGYESKAVGNGQPKLATPSNTTPPWKRSK